MAAEPGSRAESGRIQAAASHPHGSTHLQQFYDESASKDQAVDQDEDSLFAELYGKQDDVREVPASESQAKDTTMATESVSEESGSEEEGSDDDADQDVKIILMSSNDAASRPPSGRIPPNKYVRHEAPASTTSTVAPMMSTDGDLAPSENEDVAIADAQANSGQQAIAKMIPEKPDPVDSNGQAITFPTVYDVDIDALPEKPWKNPQADRSDWFNYGFDEDSWRAYCQRQVQMRLSVTKPRKQKTFDHMPNHHRKPGPLTASVPSPHRPPQPISQDVLQLGGGSNFADPASHVDPRLRHHPHPPRYDMHHQSKGAPDYRMPLPPAAHPDHGKPLLPPSKYQEPPADPRNRPPPRHPPSSPHLHPTSPRHESMARGREEARDYTRPRVEPARRSSERRDSSSSRLPPSSAFEKRGGRSPSRDGHHDAKHREPVRRVRSLEREHRREYDRRDPSYREKRPRSPVPSSRDYDSKRRR